MTRGISKRRLNPEGRRENARRWLKKGVRAKSFIEAYVERYGVDRAVAEDDLMLLGYGERVVIENYERRSIEWEAKYDPHAEDMKIVPKGTPEWELHLFEAY